MKLSRPHDVKTHDIYTLCSPFCRRVRVGGTYGAIPVETYRVVDREIRCDSTPPKSRATRVARVKVRRVQPGSLARVRPLFLSLSARLTVSLPASPAPAFSPLFLTLPSYPPPGVASPRAKAAVDVNKRNIPAGASRRDARK